MKTELEMAKTRLRLAVQEALDYGIGSAQIQCIVAEECANEVDYVKDVESDAATIAAN